MRNANRWIGFSLVELLVVIAIVGILISLLIPILAISRQSAVGINCASQLRQLGQALVIYAGSNRDYLPAWSGTHAYPPGSFGPPLETPGVGWTEELMSNYLSPKSPAFHCPAFEVDAVTYFLEARWEAIQGLRSIKVGQIRTSSSFIVSGDCTAQEWYRPPFGNSPLPFDDVDKDDANSPCLSFSGEANGVSMHQNGNNVLFGDGHVSSYASWTPSEMTYSPTLMQSYDGITPD